MDCSCKMVMRSRTRKCKRKIKWHHWSVIIILLTTLILLQIYYYHKTLALVKLKKKGILIDIVKEPNFSPEEREKYLLKRQWSYDEWRSYRMSEDFKHCKCPLPSESNYEYYEPSEEHYRIVGKEAAKERSARFPSVEERINYYMGEFYDNKAKTVLVGESFRKKIYGHWWNTLNIGVHQTYLIDSVMVNPYKLESSVFIECAEFARIRTNQRNEMDLDEPRTLKQNYCRDSVDLILLSRQLNITAPILLHYKDFIPILHPDEHASDFPLFNKVRDLSGGGQRRGGAVPDGRPYHCILWPFNRRRHFEPAAQVIKNDIHWHEKKGKLLWRGDYNIGDPSLLLKENINANISGPLQKWLLVTQHENSTLADVRYFSPEINNENISPRYIVNKTMSMKKMLQYKYLLSIEGHDMSSALKWMLFSNSVLFLPTVTWDSWAMESLLQPFVHYIPVDANMSNVEEMVLWAENHPYLAQKIAYRGKLFIYDLLFHPDSQSDEDLIMKGILQRYEKNFGWPAFTPDAHYDVDDATYLKNSNHTCRSLRFPTVDHRVQYYMGEWYNQRSASMRNTTSNYNDTFQHYSTLNNDNNNYSSNKQLIVTDDALYSCVKHDNDNKLISDFCSDAIPDFLSSHHNFIHMRHELLNEIFPLIKVIHFDNEPVVNTSNVPIFVKHRSSCYDNNDNDTKFTVRNNNCNEGIIWKFDYDSEYKIALSGQIRKNDKPFQDKISKAFWRGGLGTSTTTIQSNDNINIMRRIYLLTNSTTSIYIDAKFSHGSLIKQKNSIHYNRDYYNITDMNDTFDYDSFEFYNNDNNNTDIFTLKLNYVLSYKYIICLEDDYRSNPNLKWMLLSNSIIFMVPKPKFISWFMEDQLQPFIHYIPIKDNLSNVEEMVHWCENHPEQMEFIRQRANLYVHDMLFHSDSDQDNAEIKFKIMSIYNQRFNY